MTDRDLSSLLETATEHLPEPDLAERAWVLALAEQQRRRRIWAGTVGAVAAAGLAVTAAGLGGSSCRTPAPDVSSSTTSATGTLADGTAYAQMPLEGNESQLRHFDSGLPSVIDPHAPATRISALKSPVAAVAAVYLRSDGENFHPVVVTSVGEQVLVDTLTLVTVQDKDGNTLPLLGPRALDGRYAIVPQPGQVVRLDLQTGVYASYPVPSQHLESAGWAADHSTIVARADDQTWIVDPWNYGVRARAAGPAAYPGLFRISHEDTTPSRLLVTRQNHDSQPGRGDFVNAPVTGTWGETINTEQWAATGAFFDQDLTSRVIRLGNGPVYQGLVAVDIESRKARVLLAPENPDGQVGRIKGCCTVLGWADGKTVLFQSVGSHGSWVLAWNVITGEVFETSRITVNPAQEEIPSLALNVGWRY